LLSWKRAHKPTPPENPRERRALPKFDLVEGMQTVGREEHGAWSNKTVSDARLCFKHADQFLPIFLPGRDERR
jgi:hypothetical protein